jgi:hypothetical protein
MFRKQILHYNKFYVNLLLCPVNFPYIFCDFMLILHLYCCLLTAAVLFSFRLFSASLSCLFVLLLSLSGARFSSPVLTGPGAHPASYTMATGSFPGVKRPGRGVDHPPLFSAEVKERVEPYLLSPSGLSLPVLG